MRPPDHERGHALTEPEALRGGKAFHALVQRDWDLTADGKINIEHTIPLLKVTTAMTRRRGRIDIFVDELDGFVTVVEVKATNWDRIQPHNRQRNLASHRRQVWRYIEKYLDGDELEVCAGA